MNRLLAVVAESPRNLALLGSERAGPFLQSLTDANGRARLSWIMGTAMHGAAPECRSAAAGAAAKCSDAYGAALVDITEQ